MRYLNILTRFRVVVKMAHVEPIEIQNYSWRRCEDSQPLLVQLESTEAYYSDKPRSRRCLSSAIHITYFSSTSSNPNSGQDLRPAGVVTEVAPVLIFLILVVVHPCQLPDPEIFAFTMGLMGECADYAWWSQLCVQSQGDGDTTWLEVEWYSQ